MLRLCQNPMLTGSLAAALAAVTTAICFAAPAQALDCRWAKNAVDRLICATPSVKTADTAMRKAYLALLQASPDRRTRDLLAFSQKRWLAARAQQADIIAPTDDGDAGIAILLTEINARRDSLTPKPKIPAPLVKQINAEREFAARFSGGRFAGYSTECFFTPRPYSAGGYACTGTEVLQHHTRLCSSTIEWTSGRQFEVRRVADLVGGRPRTIATCSTDGGTAGQCPADDALKAEDSTPDVGWNFGPEDEGTETDGGKASKLDPDFPADHSAAASAWMLACLTDPHYPPRQLQSPASRQPQ